MKIHSAEKLSELVRLRKTGHSITEITKLLSLPKSTVFHHVKNIKVPENYTKILKAKQGGTRIRALMDWSEARINASELIPIIKPADKLLICACLYWAEGSKKDFCLTNTDPLLINVFMKCISELGVNKNDIRISIRVYSDINIREAKVFWKDVTGIEVSSVHVLDGKKHGKLPYGMCRIRVKKAKKYFKLITALKDRLVEKM